MDQRKRLMWRRNRRAEREHRQVALGHPQPPPQQPQPTAPRPHTRWCSAAPKCPSSTISSAFRISLPGVSPLATYSLSLRPLPSSRGRLVLFFTCTPSCLPPHGGLSIPPLDASAAAPRKQDTKRASPEQHRARHRRGGQHEAQEGHLQASSAPHGQTPLAPRRPARAAPTQAQRAPINTKRTQTARERCAWTNGSA